MSCHHCGHRRRAPSRCEECGSVAVARHGAGTESVEQELRDAFGSELPVFRLDADAAAGKGRLAQTWRGSRRRRPGCWWGPRWWPRATTSPTSRSASCSTPTRRSASPTSAPRSERSRWSPSSPAGSAGARTAARVLVQTLAPDARSIALAARHDADGFLGAGAAPAAGARLPAIRHADPDRVRVGRCGRRARAGHPAARLIVPSGASRPRPGAALPAARPLAQPAGDQVRAPAGHAARGGRRGRRLRRRRRCGAESASASTPTRSDSALS